MTAQAPSEPILGIDLGTTNSLVAIADASGPRLLGLSVPSAVRYSSSGAPEAVGHDARDHAITYPETTITSAKRLMGRSAADAAGDIDSLPYDVVEGDH
ncbi:MAG: Hsp70 family protein, partial [Planctomycetota bacterium]